MGRLIVLRPETSTSGMFFTGPALARPLIVGSAKCVHSVELSVMVHWKPCGALSDVTKNTSLSAWVHVAHMMHACAQARAYI
jgi:hypothetical protein